MKVLQFVTKLDLGGAQQTTLDECRFLLRRGCEVHLLSGSRGELADDARRIHGLVFHDWADWRHEIHPLDDLRCLTRLVRLLRRERFDVLHTHSSKAGIAGRLAAYVARTPKRVVHHVHGWSFNPTQPPFRRRAYIMLERLAARPGFALMSCSNATDREGRELGIGRDEDRHVVVNGIDRRLDLRRRDRDAIRRRLHLGRRDLLFVQLGNLKAQKDPLTFARAAVLAGRELHRARFWIAGDGPLRAATQRIALEGGLGDRFRVLGWRRDVPDLLQACDVLVLTSRFEGLPLGLLRGMAAGCPAIATAVNGTPEAVEHDVTGLLVEPGDPEDTARAMVRIGKDPALRRRMGLCARRHSERFGSHRFEIETLRLYGFPFHGGERRGA